MEFNFNNIPSIDDLHAESTKNDTTSFGQKITKDIHSSQVARKNPLKFDLNKTTDNSGITRSLGDDYSVKNLAQHSGFVGMADRYLDKRYGSSRERGETNEDVIEEYLTHYRYMSNNTIDLMQEVDFLRGADKQTKDNFQILHTIYQDAPNFMSEGGGSLISGVGDIVGSVLSDPATIVGMGFGGPIGSILAQAAKQVGKGATTRMILKTALKGNLGKIGGMTTVEGLLGGMHEAQRQELMIVMKHPYLKVETPY